MIQSRSGGSQGRKGAQRPAHRVLVLAPVVLAEVAPVAGLMAIQQLRGIDTGRLVGCLDEPDQQTPLRVLGAGGAGITGAGAAVATVCYATDKRIRHLPITPDKLGEATFSVVVDCCRTARLRSE